MIKILHSGDWHLDSPMQMDSDAKTRLLRDALARIPEKIANLCKAEQCDIMLLSGDLFDGAAGAATVAALQDILADVDVPVFITPGNHDFAAADSPFCFQTQYSIASPERRSQLCSFATLPCRTTQS